MMEKEYILLLEQSLKDWENEENNDLFA